MRDPAGMTASALRPGLRDGTLTAESVARACLARVDARDADVRAWVHVDRAGVLAQARELDRCALAGVRGPLYGLPVGVKDIIVTHDQPTQYNSAAYAGFHPRVDASCVALLRAAGAVIFGKTDTVEFGATGRKALTRNPHDLGHTPGGSSSGSAAAVADGHVPFALGTQTGGSMLRPASYCGVWGYKPTWSRVSNEGAKRYAVSLDTLGWFARDSADLALLLDALDPAPASGATGAFQLDGARIAVYRTAGWPRAEAATVDALEDATRRLHAAGATVVDFDAPAVFERLPELQMRIMRSEGASALLAEYRLQGDRLDPSLRDQVLNIDGTTSAQLLEAHDTAAQCRARFDTLASQCDAVLAPSTTGTAPAGLAATGDLVFNGLWSLLHAPCINVPGWKGRDGLPVGLTIGAPRHADRHLLDVARAFDALFCG